MKKINIYTIATITFLLITLAAGGYLLYKKNIPEGTRQYASAVHGVSFEYPAEYELAERVVENGGGTRITITEKGFRLPKDGEGPTAITVDIFTDPGVSVREGAALAEAWIASSTYSNFSISDMEAPGPTRVAGREAWLYTWDGLYRGISVVTDHRGKIFMFSVTYDGEGDLEKRQAFTEMMETVRFMDTSTSTPTSTPPTAAE